MKKNVLILYAKMGKGHVSASNATKTALDQKFGDKINTEILDFFTVASSSFSKATEVAYDGSVKFLPYFYKAFFDISDSKWPVKLLNHINYPMLSAAMDKILKENNPDIIISTFPIWDYGIAKLWKASHPQAQFINIITDSISIHQAWLIANSDIRIVPNEDTAKVLMDDGVPHSQIKILGFPVSLEFSKKINKEKVLKSLNLNPKLFTILLFATVGNNKRNVQIFEKIICEKRDYNVICVAGRNEELLPDIKHLKKEKNVAILGWRTDIPDLMKACDLIITKAGGATVMECIAVEKPMIITQVIPGQEEGNAELIENHNLGIIMAKRKKGVKDLPDYISEIRRNYSKYKNALEKQSKPDAALRIADCIAGCLGIK